MASLSRSSSTRDSGARARSGARSGEGPEVAVQVHGERAQPQVAGEDVAGEEGARRLAAAALRRKRGDDVRARDPRQAPQAGLEVRLLALASGDEQRAQAITDAADR